MGPALMQEMRDQAERFGTRFLTDQATSVELAAEPGGVHKVFVGDDEYRARTVVLAMGAEHKKLEVRGEEELSGRGVSYCATCDAAFFKDKATIVVGGGDSAMEEAIFLAKFAEKVTVVHRRSDFRASKIMLERAKATPNLEFKTPFVIEEFHPGETGGLGHAILRNVEDDSTEELPMDGAFIAIGHEPQSAIVDGQIDRDDEGYVIVQGRSTRTNRPGVFAAGDLVDHTYRQADHRRGLRLPGRARRRVVPARHAGGPDARGPAGRRPRRGAVGPLGAAHRSRAPSPTRRAASRPVRAGACDFVAARPGRPRTSTPRTATFTRAPGPKPVEAQAAGAGGQDALDDAPVGVGRGRPPLGDARARRVQLAVSADPRAAQAQARVAPRAGSAAAV